GACGRTHDGVAGPDWTGSDPDTRLAEDGGAPTGAGGAMPSGAGGAPAGTGGAGMGGAGGAPAGMGGAAGMAGSGGGPPVTDAEGCADIFAQDLSPIPTYEITVAPDTWAAIYTEFKTRYNEENFGGQPRTYYSIMFK